MAHSRGYVVAVAIATACAFLSTAYGQSTSATPDIYDVQIVEFGGRDAHVGLFPIQGQPILNSNAIVRTRLIGGATSVTLNVRDTGGALLAAYPMTTSATVVPGTYFADIVVPSQAFSLNVAGTDSSGTSFELPDPQAVVSTPQSIDVHIVPTIFDVPVGIPIVVSVRITNYGHTDRLQVSFADNVLGKISPKMSSVRVATSSSVDVPFTYTAPTQGAFSQVTFTAAVTSLTNPTTTNTASVVLDVALTQPQAMAVKLVLGGERGESGKPRESRLWLCNDGVRPSTVQVGGTLSPSAVKVVAPEDADETARHDADERHRQAADGKDRHSLLRELNCVGSSLLRLSFDTRMLVAMMNVPKHREDARSRITELVTGYTTNGTLLIGYAALEFRADSR